ncbi:hypothetical protein ACOMHN_021378 [Nucella lapillus]
MGVIRHLFRTRVLRATLAAAKASLFLLPVLWAVVGTTGCMLTLSMLFVSLYGFRVLRESMVTRCFSAVKGMADLGVTLTRIQVILAGGENQGRQELRTQWGYLKVESVRSFFYYLGDRVLVAAVLVPHLAQMSGLTARATFVGLCLTIHMHRIGISIALELVEEIAVASVALRRMQVRTDLADIQVRMDLVAELTDLVAEMPGENGLSGRAARQELRTQWGYLKVESVRSFFYYLGDRVLVAAVLVPHLAQMSGLTARATFVGLCLTIHMHRIGISIALELVEEIAVASVALRRMQVRTDLADIQVRMDLVAELTDLVAEMPGENGLSGRAARCELRHVRVNGKMFGSLYVLWIQAHHVLLLPVLVVMAMQGRPLVPRVVYPCLLAFLVLGESMVDRFTYSWTNLAELAVVVQRIQGQGAVGVVTHFMAGVGCCEGCHPFYGRGVVL